ncbi:RNA-binding protein 26 [Orchesella cincta]|uniref:RNA-binding protein 26 n=1 Tax=Orchesella cincta TaxID=48709 RepID=A0A1D2N2Q1_ORCCI|nr:RNA-binding protein 26 [Orchesella cincta]
MMDLSDESLDSFLNNNDESSVSQNPAMIVEHTESFQAWLSQVLKPLCDADPGALAKYVLALIKKDKSEKELRQSMIDQLDVFLQSETKPFVDKLFEALNNKEYLNAKQEPLQAKPESNEKANNSEVASGVKADKSSPASETEPTSSTSGPTAAVNSSTHSSSSGNEGSSKKGSNTLSVTPSALLNAGSTEASSHHNDSTGNKDDSKSRRDRRDDDRDKRRKRSRTDRDNRRTSRSRSTDRNKRSRSPRLERDRERDRDRNDRLRHRPRKSPPPRRYERDVWDRRRSRSPMRNRSASPRNRSRTPPRYRRPFNSSRSRSRSPIVRDRSRSRSRSRSPANKDKKDSLLPLPLGHSEGDQASKEISDKPLVQSVVVRPGAQQSENSDMKPGYNAVPQAPGVTGNRCRDFDEKGLCMRGELCPFDHGKDPVVLEDIVVPASGGGGNYGARGIVPGSGPGYTAPLVRPSIIGEYYPDSPSIEAPVGWGPGAPPFRPRHMARGRGGLLLRPQAMGPYPVPGQRQLISVPVVGVHQPFL